MTTPYRDETEGLHGRVAELLREIESLRRDLERGSWFYRNRQTLIGMMWVFWLAMLTSAVFETCRSKNSQYMNRETFEVPCPAGHKRVGRLCVIPEASPRGGDVIIRGGEDGGRGGKVIIGHEGGDVEIYGNLKVNGRQCLFWSPPWLSTTGGSVW